MVIGVQSYVGERISYHGQHATMPLLHTAIVKRASTGEVQCKPNIIQYKRIILVIRRYFVGEKKPGINNEFD